ncbi:MAG: hypothetical protein HY363_02640 [Candidatus Aenigmarchaeota archaeon]|nr:hypothetical protein [Candidatus Aenigmarchaeota archaeon]
MRKKEHHLLHNFEWVVDVAVPYLLVVLAALLILEFLVDLEHYEPLVSIFDYVIVSFFALDLFFKWSHVRNAKVFIRLYWIDILAVFPFYLVFRLYGLLAGALIGGEEIAFGQKIAHETVLLREAEIGKEAKFVKEVRLARGIRFAQRLLRIIKARLHIVRKEMHRRSRQLQS